jgi:hypothetical protein
MIFGEHESWLVAAENVLGVRRAVRVRYVPNGFTGMNTTPPLERQGHLCLVYTMLSPERGARKSFLQHRCGRFCERMNRNVFLVVFLARPGYRVVLQNRVSSICGDDAGVTIITPDGWRLQCLISLLETISFVGAPGQ